VSRPSADPADSLVAELTPLIRTSVDELQVTAVLESRGITDAGAKENYGYADVFALGAEVFRRLPEPAEIPPETVDRKRHQALREIMHGPLYVLPSTVYPAVFALLGARSMVWGMVFATALGWVWGMGTSWVAYRLLARELERAAGRALRSLGALGLLVALLGASAIASYTGAGPGLVAFATAQLGFQLAAGALVFYGLELRLALALLPAFAAGLFHLVSGHTARLAPPVVIAGALSVVLTIGLAWWATVHAVERPDPARPPDIRGEVRTALPSAGYAALCAALILFTDARYLTDGLDLALGAAPLVLSMGVLEWRARRFFEQAADVLREVAGPAEFEHRVWRVLLRELTHCLLVLGGSAVLLTTVLSGFGLLTSRGAMVADAHVLLGGAFFVGLVLTVQQRFAALIGVLSAVLLADVALTASISWHLAPHGEVPIFLCSTAALAVLLLAAVRRSVGEVRRYRW
jgi:hypothetical protein